MTEFDRNHGVQSESAILVGVELPDRQAGRDNLDELAGLVETAGAEVVGRMTQRRATPDQKTYLGKGKLEQLQLMIRATDADVVIFDNNLAPAQIRNLERELDVKVLDRTEVILDIFSSRARTHEARLAVELAQLEYSLPRLKRMWTHLSRIKAGVGMRGPGEKQLETDRRLVEKRIAELRGELNRILHRKEREVAARNDRMTVSLVGYTNAGKSTLLNKLTGSNEFVEDKLFATLDTRTRRWQLPGWGPVLLSDTVGFIRELPHSLIASFKATLEEARQADLLLHVADASNPAALDQIASVYKVLEELGIREKDTILVLNQIDAVEGLGALEFLKQRYPLAIPVSARTGEGLGRLAAAVSDALSQDFLDVDIETGVSNGRLLAYLAKNGEILSRTYADDRVSIHCRMPRKFVGQISPQEAVIRMRSGGNGPAAANGNGASNGHAATNGHAANGANGRNGHSPSNDLLHIDLSEFNGQSADGVAQSAVMAQRILTDRRALVTGASSGIGRALAIELARRGVDLALLARREDRLAEVAGEIRKLGRRAVIVAGDVTDPAVRRRALDAARDELGGLDILVNNAGVGAHGRFADADPGRLRPIIDVNFFAPVELIREALPLLRAGVQPIVVNIGSILGYRAAPHKSEYSASKFALHGFSEAIRPEFARLGIDVLIATVGPTDTEHFETLLEEHGELPWGDPRRKPADAVACSIVRAIERGRHEVFTHWSGRFWVLLNRLAPGLVDRIMARFG